MKGILQRSGKVSLTLFVAGLLAVTLVALVACSSYGTKTPPPSTTPAPTTTSTGTVNKVSIQGFAFNPSSITVPMGTTVTWTNNGSVTHTVTSDTGAFDSGNLAPGKTFTFTFSQSGSFAYHCKIHTYMHATVVVQ